MSFDNLNNECDRAVESFISFFPFNFYFVPLNIVPTFELVKAYFYGLGTGRPWIWPTVISKHTR